MNAKERETLATELGQIGEAIGEMRRKVELIERELVDLWRPNATGRPPHDVERVCGIALRDGRVPVFARYDETFRMLDRKDSAGALDWNLLGRADDILFYRTAIQEPTR